MKTLTLFNAYRKCRDRMEDAAFNRATRNGIAVMKDRHALKWQRYDRLAQKVELRFRGKRFCPICGCRAEINMHYSTCSRYEKETK